MEVLVHKIATWALLSGLAGCGGPPTPPPPRAERLVWLGGAPAVCLASDRLRVVQGDVQTRWHLTPEGPVLEATEPAAAPGCAPSGEAHVDGRRVVWGPSGLFLGDADGPLRWWRPAAGRLVAAAFDGQAVRAVGPDGLWQWRPGSAPVPTPLPPELQGIDPTRVFRDGPLLWVADQHAGAPLDVAGPVPVAVAPVAKLPPEEPGLQALLADRVVVARRGVAGWRIDGRAMPTVGAVSALLPHGDLLFVAAGDVLTAWRWAGGPEEVLRIPLGGPVLALFVEATPDGDRLLLVGAHQGFGVLSWTR